MPVLIVTGMDPKSAAAVNAVAVTLPSFSALLPHVRTARWDLGVAGLLVTAGIAGAFLGARLTTRYVGGAVLKRVFAVRIVAVTAYKPWSLV